MEHNPENPWGVREGFCPMPERRDWTTLIGLLGAVILVLGILLLWNTARAETRMLVDNAGECTFGKEPALCWRYVSPCFKGVDFFYFPGQGVWRERSNRIVEVQT